MSVALQDRHARSRQVEDETFVARERLIAVVRNRLPLRPVRELRPAPLVAVPVPIADEDVEEPRLQEGARVGLLPRIGGQALVERLVIEDLLRALEARAAVRRPPHGVLVELADQAREVLAELAQPRVVRHHDQALRAVQDARRGHQLVGHEERRGLVGRDLVLHQRPGPGVAQLLGKDAGGVLVDGAERVIAPVGSARLNVNSSRIEPVS